MKPVLFVTGHAPFDRVGAFARLHELEGVEFALFGGRSQHGGVAGEDREGGLPFPHRRVRQRELAALAASGRHRAVVISIGGRVALPAAWAGARRARVPVILWSALWAHPRTAAHAFSHLALRRLYRSAEAIVVYGPHVEAYVRARGARNVHVAPQSVDNEFWSHPPTAAEVSLPTTAGWPSALTTRGRSTPGWPSALTTRGRSTPGWPSAPTSQERSSTPTTPGWPSTPTTPTTPGWPSETAVKFLFAGRPVREKGLGVLIEAWSDSGLRAPFAALVLVGAGSIPPWIPVGGAVVSEVACLNPLPPVQLRDVYAAADVLVVPSIPTRTFREPWGLVVNEAMNRKLPVIASDAVGAVVGGLVRDGHNGLVVPAGDARALAGAMRRLAADAQLRARLGAAGERDVQAYTHDAWAQGFVRALHSLGLSRGERW